MITDRIITGAEIAQYLQDEQQLIKVVGNDHAGVNGYSTSFNYANGTLTFLAEEYKYDNLSSRIEVPVIITSEKENNHAEFECQIIVYDPRKAFFDVLQHFFNDEDSRDSFISSDPVLYNKYSIVSPMAVIGKNVKIGAGCVIEAKVEIGDDTEIHHNVVIRRNTKIGKRCTIFSGTIIGERGFNYTLDADKHMTMIPHFGGVRIEDDVHIGDNCCIIQGAIDDTVIKRGTKINTMVHIAHNDVIGEDTRITLPCHICGSVTIGDRCHIAGSMIRNQRHVGNDAVIGLGAVVVKDVEDGQTVMGVPAKPVEKNKT